MPKFVKIEVFLLQAIYIFNYDFSLNTILDTLFTTDKLRTFEAILSKIYNL